MPEYSKKAKMVCGTVAGAMAVGFGIGAALSGLDRHYMLAASQAVTTAAATWELYGIARYGELDGRGFLTSHAGVILTLVNLENSMDTVRLTMGALGNSSIVFGYYSWMARQRHG